MTEDIMGFFDKLKQGLSKTKNSFEEKMNNVFSNFRKVDEDLLEELEEVLIMSDVGVETSTKIIANLRDRVKKQKLEAVLGLALTFLWLKLQWILNQNTMKTELQNGQKMI